MGNEQSGAADSFFNKAKGISSPKSVRTSGAGKIIVVRAGSEHQRSSVGDPTNDEDLKRLQEIPQFLPILRSALNQSGLRDPADIYTKFSYKPIFRLCQRMQDHLVITSETVAAEQNALGTRIREIDYAVSTLTNKAADRKKHDERACSEITKVRELSSQLKKISAMLQELMPTIAMINDQLPVDDRLAPFTVAEYIPESPMMTTPPINIISEQRVIDEH